MFEYVYEYVDTCKHVKHMGNVDTRVCHKYFLLLLAVEYQHGIHQHTHRHAQSHTHTDTHTHTHTHSPPACQYHTFTHTHISRLSISTKRQHNTKLIYIYLFKSSSHCGTKTTVKAGNMCVWAGVVGCCESVWCAATNLCCADHLNLYICINICIYIYIYVFIYVHIDVYIFGYVCIHICRHSESMWCAVMGLWERMSERIRENRHGDVGRWAGIFVCVYVYTYTYICMYIYIYIYMYIYTYVYICTHTRTQTRQGKISCKLPH